jgi:hypothetical protein
MKLPSLGLVVLIAILLGLAGCGLDSSSDEPSTATVTFYTTNATYGTMTWKVNNVIYGQTTGAWPAGTKPTCGEDSGPTQLTISIAPGTYAFVAESATGNFSPGVVTWQAGVCYSYFY